MTPWREAGQEIHLVEKAERWGRYTEDRGEWQQPVITMRGASHTDSVDNSYSPQRACSHNTRQTGKKGLQRKPVNIKRSVATLQCLTGGHKWTST